MKVNYDMMADAVYVSISDKKVARTIKTEDNVAVDLDTKGSVVGIEILNASAQRELIASLEKDVSLGIPVTMGSKTLAAA